MTHTVAYKNRYQITLELEVYDDLNVNKINWETALGLEGDESVHASIKSLDVPD